MSTVTEPRTLKQLAQEALRVQNTSNPIAIAQSYAKAILELRERLSLDKLPSDTDSIKFHCINRLWVDKLHDLAGLTFAEDALDRANAACKELANA